MAVPNLNMLTDPVFLVASCETRWTPNAALVTRCRLRTRGNDPYLWQARGLRLGRFPANAGIRGTSGFLRTFFKYLWEARGLDKSVPLQLTPFRIYERKMPARITGPAFLPIAKAVSGLVAQLLRQDSRGEPSWVLHPIRRSSRCAGYAIASFPSSALLRAGLRKSFQP